MSTSQIFANRQSSQSTASQRLFLSKFLANISMAWKMNLMVIVFFLGILGITVTAYIGLQSLRYQLSNIYDFMLVPIVAIGNADTSLADAQYQIKNLNESAEAELTKSFEVVQADVKLTDEVMTRYDTEWVTTVSPDFTQSLKDAGKLDLQQQEVAALKSFHESFDAYKAASEKYFATVQAGQPDANLAIDTIGKLQSARVNLKELINVNNTYADFSNSLAQTAFQQALISGGIVLFIGLAFGLFMSYLIVVSITSRLGELTQSAAAMQKGNLDQTVEIGGRDEVSLLGATFNSMASQLKNSFSTLENRVADRTRNLELAAQVGRTVSQVRVLDVMLKNAAELIRSQFGLYYAQVYLINSSQTELVLQAGTGSVGVELIGRNHRLPLNTGSINGRAATEKHPVVISDTTTSPTFRPNPLLPDTRSEMAVPLLVGEKVVGVLDLQSQEVNALTQDNLTAFEALAGQLAIAIQNANLLAETEQARAEVEAQARRLTRANWLDYLDAIHQPEEIGFVFEQNKIAPLAQAEQASEHAFIAPIAVTGESLGNLIVEMEGQSPIARADELVNAVARQVSQHIESLRLLESAERYRAEAEQASRRSTREGWKDYTDANAAKGLSYTYDLNEVRTFDQAENQQAEKSALNLPLKVRDETIGKLVVQGLGSDDSEALELATAVAQRLGAHIESLRQQDQTQSALAQTEKLSAASLRFAQSADLQELLVVANETLGIQVVNRSLLGVFNYNSANDLEDMVIVANWWNGSGNAPSEIGRRYTLETLNALPFFMSATPVFSNDTFDDERVSGVSLQLVKQQNIRSMAVLPLYLGSHQIGVLFLESEETHSFSQSDTRLFSAMAPQIATVLENRRQFERAQKQAERESTLNVISQKIQSATSVEAVLQIAARELGHALGAPRTIAQLSIKDKK